MINIYHVPLTRSVRAIWTCEELGLDYTITPVDFSAEYRSSDEWRNINPVGKVPAMRDGDFLMFESGAMVQYLLDKYGAGQLQPPPGSEAHALYLQWSWFAESTFARPLGEMVNHAREFPGDNQIPEVLNEMANRAELCVNAVADALSDRQFLLGDEFTAADIMMGYSLMLAHRLIPERVPASIENYWNSLNEREGFEKALQV